MSPTILTNKTKERDMVATWHENLKNTEVAAPDRFGRLSLAE